MVKERIRKTAYNVFTGLNHLVPKTEKVFIYGGDFLSDNSEAMLRFLADNYDIRIECIADKRIKRNDFYKNVVFKKNTIFNALITSLSSKVILDSSLHTIKMKPCRNQTIIQMWHGSPLKHLPTDPFINNGMFYSFLFYASEMFRDEMKKGLSADDKQMYLAGGPRNDYLFKGTAMPEMYKSEGKAVMWLPTFRRGIGLKETSNDIPIITGDNIEKLERFLKSKNTTLFIKPHPLQLDGLKNVLSKDDLSAIRLISDVDMWSNGITLYEMLGNMDALITDYSSVYFDYLLLDRPIGFTVEDIIEYNTNRGFALNPPEDYMPGAKLKTLEDIFEFLNNLNEEVDSFKEERKMLNTKANVFIDDKNCQRCAELVMKRLSK